MGEGQNLNQFFKYFGLGDHNLKLRQLDINCFDSIQFGDEFESYSLAQGYDNFAASLKVQFPEEHKAIDEYCRLVRDYCARFKLYNLQVSGLSEYMDDPDLLQSNAYDVVSSLTNNPRLFSVLTGNMMLYAGNKAKTPFFVHALVTNSYIESSYRIADGGSQIAIELSREIRKMGGKLFRRKAISGAHVEDRHIKYLITEDGDQIYADNFISNLHPSMTMDLIGAENFKKPFRTRIGKIENSVACFCSHFVLEDDSFDYLNYNIYHHKTNDEVWNISVAEKEWPASIMISTPANSKNPSKANGITAMTYMDFKNFESYGDTFNTVTTEGARGNGYEKVKLDYQERLLKRVEQKFPGISNKIKHAESSTPLTFRDYLNTPEGTSYGMWKDCDMPFNAFINPKTNVKNLYLTGQNVVMHGILGVTVGSFLTCFYFLDKEKLIEEVRNS
ncbi:MAG: all-trans-retinol 13,14-reductase [Flavobacteriales bacterium]|nr:all-trans-retinol 13,14-reductase [Flavobacteriales bacterium]